MGIGSSRKRQAEFSSLKHLLLDVSEIFTDTVKSLNDVQMYADKFVSQLETRDRDPGLMDTGVFNVVLFGQSLLNLSTPAIHLLEAIEACKENKARMVKHVNSNLQSIRTEVERLCEIKLKDFPDFQTESDVTEKEEIKPVNRTSNAERMCAVMVDSVKSMTLRTHWNIKANKLETKVLKMEEMLAKLSSEKSATELRLQKVEDAQEHLHVSVRSLDAKCAKEIVPAVKSTFVQTILTKNDESKQLRLATKQIKREKEALREELSKKIVKLEQELKTVPNQLDELNKEKDNLRKEMQERLTCLEKEKRVIQERVKEAEEKFQSLEDINEMLQRENDTVKAGLNELKNRRLLQIQIYSQQRSDLMSDIENELMALLKSKMQNSITEVDFIKCLNTSHIQTDKPLLLLCISASRLGTDASNALNSIKVTSDMALLVFHHKDVHALPNQASDRVLSGPEFKGLGGIFDMAFLSGKGIYPCEMNDNNTIHVQHFIRQSVARNEGNN